MRFEHVNLSVSDIERSIAFYGDLLGFHVRWRGQTGNGAPAAHVGDEQSYIALFQADKPGSRPRDYSTVGMNHFGFVVDSLDDMKNRLARAGIKPHAEQEYDPGRRLYFFDPDGIEVELVEYEPAVV